MWFGVNKHGGLGGQILIAETKLLFSLTMSSDSDVEDEFYDAEDETPPT